ncbi:MAG: hypothetical protein IPF82_06770 [Blastocatellia bacterium]|nr:hypothetical protein [Blastocatellia bacterium]
MTIIRFPGGKGPGGQSELIDLAVHLKQRLISFVVAGKLRPLFVESIEENDVDFVDEGDRIEFTDWFIFEWEDVDGSTTIEHFLASNDDLPDREREMLSAWDDGALDDLFESRTCVAVSSSSPMRSATSIARCQRRAIPMSSASRPAT